MRVWMPLGKKMMPALPRPTCREASADMVAIFDRLVDLAEKCRRLDPRARFVPSHVQTCHNIVVKSMRLSAPDCMSMHGAGGRRQLIELRKFGCALSS